MLCEKLSIRLLNKTYFIIKIKIRYSIFHIQFVCNYCRLFLLLARRDPLESTILESIVRKGYKSNFCQKSLLNRNGFRMQTRIF